MKGSQDREDVNEESVTYFVRMIPKGSRAHLQSRYMKDWPVNHVEQEYNTIRASYPNDQYTFELVEIRRTLSRKTLSSEEIEKLFASEK